MVQMSEQKWKDAPTSEQLHAELERVKYHKRYIGTLRNTIYALVALATVVLLAVMWMPVYRVTGASMEDTLKEGDIVVTWRTDAPARGDIVALNCDNGKTLLKRVIAVGGDTLNILEDGSVWLNGAALEEEYVSQRALGECDIALPLTIPEGYVFVMGDHRIDSVDSRSTVLGCVATEQVIGRVIARVWPLDQIQVFQ